MECNAGGFNMREFVRGLKAGVPIAIGYIPIALAFGILARSYDIDVYIAALMSAVIFAGASQFIGINLLAMGASCGEIVITTFLLNLRHFLMTATLSQRLESGVGNGWRAALSFGVTDETFAVSVLQAEDRLSRYFVLGLNTAAFASWNIGTWLGMVFAAGLPERIKISMGIALYAMFIGLLVPHVKKSRPALVVAVVAMAVNTAMYLTADKFGFSAGAGIVVATICGAAVGAGLYAQEDV